jgi:hypothetical protein
MKAFARHLAVLILALAPVTAGHAQGYGRGDGRDEGRRAESRGEGQRGGESRGRMGRAEPRAEMRGDGRRDDRDGGGYGRPVFEGPPPGYAYGPPAYYPAPAPAYAYPPPGYIPNSLGAGWGQQQDQARRGVRQGGLMPLGQIIAGLRRSNPGRLLDAGLEPGPDGRPAYRVRWAGAGGRRTDFIVDAASGAIIGRSGY